MTSTALAEQQLSTAMREGSEAEHDAAENSDFTVELLAGRINAAGYTALPESECVGGVGADAVRLGM